MVAAMSGDAKQLIEEHTKWLLEEVPALKPLKLVVGFDMVGRGDIQQFRMELPDITVTKDIGTDARIRVEMRREFFNLMVEHGAKVADWREAFHDGKAKATGVQQYIRLIVQVIEKQEERDRLKRQTRRPASS
jgi:hypothetical protein